MRASPDGRSASYFRATLPTFGRDTAFDIVTARGRRAAVPAGFANWGAYSPTGDLLATVVNSRLQVWDPETGHLLRQTKLSGIVHAEAATFSADGSWIVVGDRSGVVQALDAGRVAPGPEGPSPRLGGPGVGGPEPLRAGVDSPAPAGLGVFEGKNSGLGQPLLAGVDHPDGDDLAPACDPTPGADRLGRQEVADHDHQPPAGEPPRAGDRR